MDHWSFSILRAHGLQHIHKDKSWRPIVCVSVDCSGGNENHCPTYETVLGTDGQNPNQKEVFWLPKPPKPSSKFTIQVHYRSPSKKKSKKRVLVASCTCSIGELVTLQRQEPKPHLRLTTHSSSLSKSSKSPKHSAVTKRSPASVNPVSSTSSKGPAHRLGHATMQVRVVLPSGLETDKEWRQFSGGKPSLDSISASMSDGEGSIVIGDESEFVASPTSSRAPDEQPGWPSSPSALSSAQHSQQHEAVQVDPHPYPHQSTNVLRRRKRRRIKRPVKGYCLDTDESGGEYWISESCTCTDTDSGEESEKREDKRYNSPTAASSHRVEDDSDEGGFVDSVQVQQEREGVEERGRSWYTEIIHFTRYTVDFLPMMDPGILPMFRTRDGGVDTKESFDTIVASDTETASVYSNDTLPEQYEVDELDLGEGSKSSLSLDSISGSTLVDSPVGSLKEKSRRFSFSSTKGRSPIGVQTKTRKAGVNRKLKRSIKRKSSDEIEMEKWHWWERLLCTFTMYAEMKRAGELYYREGERDTGEEGTVVKTNVRSNTRDLELGSWDNTDEKERVEEEEERVEEGRYQFERIFQRLQVEWTYIGGVLVALAAVDTAVFAISPSTLFPINSYAISLVSASSVFTGVGIVCDAWFFLRYAWCDLDRFLSRSLDIYSTHIFFSISARIPALCLFLSSLALLGFLTLTAYSAWPTGVMVVCFLGGLGMGLQFVVRGVEVVGRAIGRGVKALGKGVVRVVGVPVKLVIMMRSSVSEDGAGGSGTLSTSTGSVTVPKPKLKPASPPDGRQKVSDLAVGEDSEVWRGRLKKARVKVKLQGEARKERRKKEKEKDSSVRI